MEITTTNVELLRQAREAKHRAENDAFNKDMEAIERVAKMLKSTPLPIPPPPPAKTLPKPENDSHKAEQGILLNGELSSPTAAIRESYPTLPNEFSLLHVRAYLSKHHPGIDTGAGTLTPSLKRMAKQKMIEVAVAGSSNAPTIYRKLK